MPNRMILLMAGGLLSAAALAGERAASTDSFDDDWLNSDPEAEHYAINDGQLTFLSQPPQQPVHHYQNTLIVKPESLRDGWVKMIQCHDHLDRFPSVQIVYNRKRTKGLKVDSVTGVGQAWVEDNSVQLRDVKEGARVCVHAQSRALSENGDGTYILRNGPFMRRFLDGYFPMQVSINVQIPEQLKFVGMSPAPTDAVELSHDRHSVHYNAWFEGRLNTEIRFKQVQ
jgi:hypothetical protein